MTVGDVLWRQGERGEFFRSMARVVADPGVGRSVPVVRNEHADLVAERTA
jgi:hypothetical protein